MTDPGKTGTAGSFGNDPASAAFIAECAEMPFIAVVGDLIGGNQAARTKYIGGNRADPLRAHRRTQTVYITLTVDLPGDLRVAADGALRREFPRGKWEITDAN